jgi:cell division protein FtsB
MSRPAPARTEAVKKNQATRAAQGNAKKSAAAPRSRSMTPTARKSNTVVSHVRRAPAVKEVRMANKPFPMATLSLLAIFTVMIMVIIVSFAQNYELSSDIAALEAQAQALAQSERELVLALEERDDIRVIEDIAVNRIGMVRGNLVESRFVSVSGGDRIVLNNQDKDAVTESGGYGLFSTMLSAIGENLDKLREYVD